MENKKVLLIIMDGWGEGNGSKSDIIANSNVPYIKGLYKTAAYSQLRTSGEDVGLPDGQMGNSEVGHLNIGAGRIVYQDLVKINLAIKDKSIFSNQVILDAYQYAKNNNKAVHLLGLVSDGGVHSSMEHLMALCDIAKEQNLNDIFIHAFTDGRDTDPKSGMGYLKSLEEHLKNSAGKVASVCGRYYAMDRDKRWERVKLAYDMLVHGQGEMFNSSLQAIESSYAKEVTDEFIKPSLMTGADGKPLATIKEGDVVLCFNFRTDRLREITHVLSQKDMPDFGMSIMPLYYVTITRYDESFQNVKVIYDKDDLKNTLGETLANNGKTQLRIAETEKYPHVTFFFSGGREEAFPGESRVLVSSPKVATYDLQPSMSAPEVKDKVVAEINKNIHDFICLNFANADMVGHTGIIEAITEALETVDKCVKEVCEAALANHYTILITADHGNADYAVNEDGSPNTAHTTNPVPLFLIDSTLKSIKPGRLCDLAPTILNIMGLPIPSEMDGEILA